MSDKELIIGNKSYRDFLIGSDPEFKFKGLKARDYVPFEGEFGADGPSAQISELRPTPKICPLTHAFEIEQVLRKGYRKFPKIQGVSWHAGSMQENNALGGHIHFGLSNKDESFPLVLEALDKLLAPICLNLEEPESARARRNTNYGHLALDKRGKLSPNSKGYELKDYGGFEYRTPASWIVSKQIARGVLCLAKVITFEAYNYKNCKHLPLQLRFVKHDERFISAFDSCDKIYFIKTIPIIQRIIKTFKLYPRYSKYINYLFQLIYQGRTWSENADLKDRWNIVAKIIKTEKDVISELVTLEKAWENALNESWTIQANPEPIFVE